MSDGLRAIRDLGVGDWSWTPSMLPCGTRFRVSGRTLTTGGGVRQATSGRCSRWAPRSSSRSSSQSSRSVRSATRSAGQRACGHGSSVVLARAFPVLARRARPVDVAPPGLEPAGLNTVRASRQVYVHGAARMWLVPGRQLICLVGTRLVSATKNSSSIFALLTSCAPRAVAATRGLISLTRSQGAFSSATGILPVGASDLAALPSRNRPRASVRHQLVIPLNQARVFAIRFANPITTVRYTAWDGRVITYRASPTKAPTASG